MLVYLLFFSNKLHIFRENNFSNGTKNPNYTNYTNYT